MFPATLGLVLLGAALVVGVALWVIQRRAVDPFADLRERLHRQALTASAATILTDTLDTMIETLGAADADAWLWEPGGMVKLTARGAGGNFPVPEVNPWAGVGDPSSPIGFVLTFGPAGMIRVGRVARPAAREAAKRLVPAVTAALEAAFLRQKQAEEIEALKARLERIESGV